MRNQQVSEKKLTYVIDVELDKDVEQIYRRYEELNQAAFESGSTPDFSSIIKYAGLNFMTGVAFSYTRGDPLNSIDKIFMQPAVDRLLRAGIEIDKRKMRGNAWFWSNQENVFFGKGPHLSAPAMVSVFTFYAWLLCFGTPKNKIEALSNFVVPAGNSISVDTVIQYFQPSRKIGEINLQQAELFNIWTQMYTLKGDEQIAVIKDYLDNWAKYLTQCHGIPFGALATYLNIKHKSNKTLVKELERNEHIPFYGHWAWEVALAVKLCDIDDTEFRDHQLYPVDAVDYIEHLRHTRDDWRADGVGADVVVKLQPVPKKIDLRKSKSKNFKRWLELISDGDVEACKSVMQTCGVLRQITEPILFIQVLRNNGLALSADLKDDSSLEFILIRLIESRNIQGFEAPETNYPAGPGRSEGILSYAAKWLKKSGYSLHVIDMNADCWGAVLVRNEYNEEYIALSSSLSLPRDIIS